MRRISVSVLTAVLVLGVSAQGTEALQSISDQIKFPVEKYKLSNGLTVLLHEDHSVPLISYHQWFRVGSRHEKVGRTGLAHFFEHLMFKGTKKISGKEFESKIRGNGGSNNAFTSRDYTGYFEDMPAGTLPMLVDIESDRMRNLLFDEKEIRSEREVVKEERRYRVEDSVFGSMWEAIFKSVYKVHPYRWPVVGYMKDLNAASIDDLKEFYKVHYAPNNAVIIVVGDFDSEEAKKLIEKKYGSIPAQTLPETEMAEEPEQKGIRRQTIRKNVQGATVGVVYRAPSSGTDDSYSLDLLSMILGSGSSSRLYKDMVYKKQKAMSVSSGNYSMKEDGIFYISASLKPGVSTKSSVVAINSHVNRLRNKMVTDQELEKAKNQVMKEYVDGMKTVSGKARILAINEIYFGDYSQMFKDLDRYNGVTKEDIRNVAHKYLSPERQNIIKILPKKK